MLGRGVEIITVVAVTALTADQKILPQEWLSTLIWGLAVEMAPEYDCPPARFQMLKAELAEKMDSVAGFDREPEPIYFGVSMGDNYSGGSGH